MREPRYAKLIQLPDGTWAYPLFHENRRVDSGGRIAEDDVQQIKVRSEAA
jgi:hypothetical protein